LVDGTATAVILLKSSSMLKIGELAAYGITDFIVNAIIYISLALAFFAAFWVIFKERFQSRRIQQKRTNWTKGIRYEVKNSFIALSIFSVIDIVMYVAYLKGYTKIYDEVGQYGWLYLVFSVIMMIVLHDAWFYFTHRLMHHPKLYRYVHKVHHNSTDPSPFAAFSIHPFEVLIDVGIFVVFAFSFPVHLIALWAWQLIHMTLNVIGHLGYEIYPKGFNRHWLFKFKATATHHNMHHAKTNGNFCFYFTWWDKIFKTEFKDYNEVYDNLHHRVEKSEPEKTYRPQSWSHAYEG
jgi:sterol desaturase/sphingolipid hydroxylase (fatty acid hydroxylase superfamily)